MQLRFPQDFVVGTPIPAGELWYDDGTGDNPPQKITLQALKDFILQELNMSNLTLEDLGQPNGPAKLDENGRLTLSDGNTSQAVVSVTPATETSPAMLSFMMPVDSSMKIGNTGKSLLDLANTLPDGSYTVQENGVVMQRPSTTGIIPDDFELNGNIYIAPTAYLDGTKAMPSGLFCDTNTGIVLTDGTVFYPGTTNNVGVLCATAE